ncbi:MAG: hypothetical protein JNK02_13715 [Planctomycetes bacterium]|nr:hypothetical protein [Planctomycetota bacterium]
MVVFQALLLVLGLLSARWADSASAAAPCEDVACPPLATRPFTAAAGQPDARAVLVVHFARGERRPGHSAAASDGFAPARFLWVVPPAPERLRGALLAPDATRHRDLGPRAEDWRAGLEPALR